MTEEILDNIYKVNWERDTNDLVYHVSLLFYIDAPFVKANKLMKKYVEETDRPDTEEFEEFCKKEGVKVVYLEPKEIGLYGIL